MRLSAVALVTVLPLAACGDDGGGNPANDAGAPDAAPQALLDPPPAGEGVQYTLDVEVAAGMEVTYCQYVVVTEAMDISRFEHRYSEGSHHLLLYQTEYAEADVPSWERFECGSTFFPELGVNGIAYAAQVPEGELAYPAGVALKFAAGDVVLIQSHYLNTTDSPIDAEVRLNAWKSTVPVEMEAGTLFFYDWAIYVPAGGSAFAKMYCQIPDDVTLVYAMSHMHKQGVGYTSQLVGGALPEPLPLFQTTSWEDIEPQKFEPALQVTAGQAIEFRCEYQNDGTEPVMEGPSAEVNEMCMFIAAYWPKVEDPRAELCQLPGSGPRFEGTTTCAETLNCTTAAGEDLLAAEQCLVNTCAASSPAVADFGSCVFNLCNVECTQGMGDCDGCVINNCIDQYGACQAATCE